MKQEPWRRDAASYPLHGELQPRYTDVDLWQHLNNTALISLHAEACQRWLRGVFGATVWRDAAPLIAKRGSATDFLAEAHYPEPLATGVRLGAVDDAGFSLASALFQHGRCVGLQETVFGVWQQGAAAPLPAALRQTLAAAAAAQPPLPAATAAEGVPPAGAALPPPPAPPRWADFPWQSEVMSRFADSDARGLTSDTSLARATEQTRAQFLGGLLGAERLGDAVGFMVAHVELHWLQRGRSPAHWRVGCGVTRLGERSIAVRGALFDGETCVAVGDTVMAAIDRASRRSAALPEAVRAKLAPCRLPAAPAA